MCSYDLGPTSNNIRKEKISRDSENNSITILLRKNVIKHPLSLRINKCNYNFKEIEDEGHCSLEILLIIIIIKCCVVCCSKDFQQIKKLVKYYHIINYLDGVE